MNHYYIKLLNYELKKRDNCDYIVYNLGLQEKKKSEL